MGDLRSHGGYKGYRYWEGGSVPHGSLVFLFWRSWSNDPLVDIRLLETRVIENAKKRRKEIHRDPSLKTLKL